MSDEVTQEVSQETVTTAEPPSSQPEEKPVEKQPDGHDAEKQRILAAATQAERARRERELEVQRLAAAVKERDELLQLLQKDPVAFFERSGIDFSKVARAVLDKKRPGPVDQLAEKVSKLEAELAERRAREEEAYYRSLEDAARRDVAAFIEKHVDKYEFCAASPDTVDLVLDAMESHYARTGQIDMEAAVRDVEVYLEGLAQKFTKAKKINKFLSAVMDGSQQSANQATPGKTLTNTTSATIPTRDTGGSNGMLSREESIARAARLLKFGTD